MGNCAGGKTNPPNHNKDANHNPNAELKKAPERVEIQPKLQHPQQPSIHFTSQTKQQKQENVLDEYPAIDSLQIESARKEIPKEIVHDVIKETEEHGSKLAKQASSAIKESVPEHQFTFQNSATQDEIVADENVGNFHNPHVKINFQITAN